MTDLAPDSRSKKKRAPQLNVAPPLGGDSERKAPPPRGAAENVASPLVGDGPPASAPPARAGSASFFAKRTIGTDQPALPKPRRSREPAPVSIYEWKRMVAALEANQEQLEAQNATLRQAEERLDASRDRYRELYDEASSGYLTLNVDSSIVDANATFARMVKSELVAILGQPFYRFVDSEDEGVFDRHRARMAATAEQRKCEVRLVAADGKRIWVQLASTRSKSRASPEDEWRMVVTDVTERKDAQDELHHQKEFLQAVLDGAPVVIATLDSAGVVRFANRAWERILGWTTAELREQRIWPRLFPHRRTRDSAREFVRQATGLWRDFRVSARFGDIVDLRCAVAALSGDTRLMIAQDVTEQRRVEDRLREERESLRRAAGINTISEMAAAIAHEVNQPLTALINYATGASYRLRALPGIPREALEAVDNTVIEAHRTANIIRQIRTLVCKRRIEQAPLDINGLVRRLADLLSPDAARADVAVQVACEPALPQVAADRVQIEQVIVNLVNNAVEAMDKTIGPNREVLLCTRRTDDASILVSVVDRGHGLSPEVTPKLFTPFFTTKPYGTGIGLSLCLSIVEAHGGRLWADPNPEGGAVFRFTLPVYRADSPQVRPPHETEVAPRDRVDPPPPAGGNGQSADPSAALVSSSG